MSLNLASKAACLVIAVAGMAATNAAAAASHKAETAQPQAVAAQQLTKKMQGASRTEQVPDDFSDHYKSSPWGYSNPPGPWGRDTVPSTVPDNW